VKLHQQQLIGGHIAAAVGREVGQQLDYLNQELVRFKEERRMHAMVMLAERQRSMREAEEKGKREEEEKRRATQDEMYRQIMQVRVFWGGGVTEIMYLYMCTCVSIYVYICDVSPYCAGVVYEYCICIRLCVSTVVSAGFD